MNGGDTELFTGILRSESLNSMKQVPSCRITEMEYWSAKSFPKINRVLMPFTTLASTFILTIRGVKIYVDIDVSRDGCITRNLDQINLLSLFEFGWVLHFGKQFLRDEGDV